MKKSQVYDDGQGYNLELPDMPEVSPPTEEEINAMADERTELDKLKERLPMLYTARGNLIKRKARAVTGKTFAMHRVKIDALNTMGNHLVIYGDGWTLDIDIPTSNALREHGQVEGMYLAGWEISLI